MSDSGQLRRAGFSLSRDRVRRLMRKMGIHALYRKPRTTIPEQGHKVYPYRLHGLAIDRPNQVWAADISVPQRHRKEAREELNFLVEAA